MSAKKIVFLLAQPHADEIIKKGPHYRRRKALLKGMSTQRH